MKWVTVAPDYLQEGKAVTPQDKVSWVNFLENIGVKKGIVIERVTEKVSKVLMHCYYRGFGGI